MNRTSQPKILLVDDEVEATRALSFIFKSAGYCIETFTSAQSALDRISIQKQLYNHQNICALITDIVMPGISGTDLIIQLRASGFLVPIFALTGQFSKNLERELLGCGCTAVFEKPVDSDKILLKVSECICKENSYI